MTSGNEQWQAVDRARVEAAFTALAAGDALGWPQEFIGRKHCVQPAASFRDWEWHRRFQPYTETICAGEYSDDTQLTLAVARSRLMAGSSWWHHFTQNELPLWTLYERGGGDATKRAAGCWVRGVAPWNQSDVKALARYFEAGGNGVAMRVLPHAIFHAEADDPSALLKDIVVDGSATHGHPRALVGAAAYAYAAWWLLRVQHTVGFGELITVLLNASSTWGAPPVASSRRNEASSTRNEWLEEANNSFPEYEQLWADVVEEMRQLLQLSRNGLEQGVLADDDSVLEHLGAFSRAKGSGTISAAAAIYLAARYATQPAQAVLRAAFALGSDTDTIAAMTGGLVGALGGSDWLPPEWDAVQDIKYLRQIASDLAVHAPPGTTIPKCSVVTPKVLETIVESLVEGHQGDLDFGATRKAHVVDIYRLKPSTPSINVAGWQLATSDGQTLFVTKIGKTSKEEMAQVAMQRRSSDPPLKQPPPRTEENLEVRAVGVKSEYHARVLPRRVGKTFEARAGGVKLTVLNLAASTAFYRSLGLVATPKMSNRFVSFGAISLVEKQPAIDLSRGAATEDAPTQRNGVEVEVHVGNIDAARNRLAARGHSIEPIIESSWGELSFHCFDLDGNRVEVIEKSLLRKKPWR
ncbi:MAG: ADP-ribosylglycohydrolase family protein [Polyangiaceae bacterium]|nr:ADP-ribosylglycohydrolase family protein [Polyangiaceae bacterium]